MNEKKDPRTGPVDVVPHWGWRDTLLSVAVGIIAIPALAMVAVSLGQNW